MEVFVFALVMYSGAINCLSSAETSQSYPIAHAIAVQFVQLRLLCLARRKIHQMGGKSITFLHSGGKHIIFWAFGGKGVAFRGRGGGKHISRPK